jgi:protein MPE1
MSSSIFYKFRSSKEPTRLPFDGTGITVFEIKREIISLSGLGDGTDFDLHIYDESSPDIEYDDDTTIVSRGSTVIARRLPAARPGHGKAARYVSGKPPANSLKNMSRTEQIRSNAPVKSAPVVSAIPDMGKAQTEDERIKAMLAAEGSQWEQQRQQMAK